MSDEIDFVSDKERELFARAKLGEDLRAFLASDVGRYLHGRAREDYEAAKEELRRCNPDGFWGRRKWRRARQRADIAELFMLYCIDAIQDGEVAFRELEEHEKDHLT